MPKLSPISSAFPSSWPATPARLKQIEREAKIIAAQLIERRFSWANYLAPAAECWQETVPLADRLTQFKAYLMAQPCVAVAAMASRKTA
ncbi:MULTISPECIES: hypothetical protein [Cyanophyceae]|uniref:hypothetical protein n=1 Tax=Cyanophyceae TaxID=3028117 RepID=UPI0018EFE129|nr:MULTISPECIES: hypothetical protein [Cyanophyceae]